MKKIKCFAALMLAALMLAFAGCGSPSAAVGPMAAHNVARLYSPSERESRFILDGKPVEGSAKGTAYMETSSRGDTSLAWVDGSVLYFVSEKGVDRLGTGISTAELSFDGRIALFLEGNELKMYSADDRGVTVLDTGIESIVQFAISPGGKAIAYTAIYEGGEDPVVKLIRDGSTTVLFEGGAVAVLAVSDDADIVWFFDSADSSFGYDKSGERTVVSTECGADANYNFTNDLKEVAFNTSDGQNHLYRMASGGDTLLGDGFDFTLKTDVFSISTVTLFTYINDVDTFTNGLWQKRVKLENGTLYSAGLIDGEGNITWLAEDAASCGALPDGSRVIWVSGGQLYSTDMKGKNTLLASEVDSFKIASDGYVYFLSGNVLYSVKGEGRPSRVDSGAADIEVIGSRCVYLKEDGKLMSVSGVQTLDISERVSAIDGRAGQLLAYEDPADANGETVYNVLVTTDGVHFERIAEGIRH